MVKFDAKCGNAGELTSLVPVAAVLILYVVQSALFAVLSILLLMFITDRGDLSSYLHSPAGTALSIFSYSAILLNGSAAVTALVMTDKVGGLSMKASRRSALSPEKGYISGDAKLLNRYGIGTAWSWVFGHCQSLSSMALNIY